MQPEGDRRVVWPVNGVTVFLALVVVVVYTGVCKALNWSLLYESAFARLAWDELLDEAMLVWGLGWLLLNAARLITSQRGIPGWAFATGIGIPIILGVVKSLLWVHENARQIASPPGTLIYDSLLTVLPFLQGLVIGGALGILTRSIGRTVRRKGFCRKCNYNLRGNVSGVCPGCGTPIRPEGR